MRLTEGPSIKSITEDRPLGSSYEKCGLISFFNLWLLSLFTFFGTVFGNFQMRTKMCIPMCHYFYLFFCIDYVSRKTSKIDIF